MNGSSAIIANQNGTFQSAVTFSFDQTSSFTVEDGQATTQTVNIQNFVNDMATVTSDAELDTLLMNENY